MAKPELTLNDIRLLRQEMETDISFILNKFETNAGIEIRNLNISHSTSSKYDRRYVVRSELQNPFEF